MLFGFDFRESRQEEASKSEHLVNDSEDRFGGLLALALYRAGRLAGHALGHRLTTRILNYSGLVFFRGLEVV